LFPTTVPRSLDGGNLTTAEGDESVKSVEPPTFRLHLPKFRRVVVATVGVASVIAALAVGAPANAAPSSGLVINEVYGGGGNSGATFTNDFIELANRGTTAVDVSGYAVQYHSGSATGAWQSTDLTGSIAPGDFYLVAESKGANGTTPLPSPNVTGTIAMSATAGTVALTNSQTLLTCLDSASCEAASVDLVGFGTAAIFEGADATGASNTASEQRATTVDTDNNAADFTAAAPTPGAANTGASTGGGGGSTTPGDTRIHDIQGTSWISPLNNQKVTDVPGIVTGIRATGSSRGYWIQDPDADSNPATSEGIFVYTSTPNVAVGDSVLVSATVKDFYPLASGDTVATTSNLSVTELEDSTVSILSHGNALPAPITLTSTTVPDQYAPDLGGANIESTTIDPTRSALDYYESIEGMRVEVDDARVVGPSDSFGEQYITTKPAQNTDYRGGTLLTAENATPSGRLEVVPADGSNPQVSVGDVFTGPTVGPIDYSQYGGYLIAATTLGTVESNHLAPVVATKQQANQLSVATYNVENLAPSDPADKYARLAAGVVTNLASPDIIAVEEVQDNDGATDDGTVAADQTLTKLETAISAAGGPTYQSRSIDPVNDQDGGQPGGNIRVVFLFNPARVSFVDSGSSTVNRSTTATTVTKSHGKPALSLSPGRIDPTSDAWTSSRKPLVGEFRFKGQDVFVIGNHFDAKLGDQSQDGRFQYPAQSSAVQRKEQATEVNSFVTSLLKVDKKAKVVVAGDLNDYQFSPALSTLTGAATGEPILKDLITTLPANQQYTYDYEGVSEVLDHILVTSGVGTPQYQVVHINSEYANQVSDHDPQVVRLPFGKIKPESRVIPPKGYALGYSDALDKLTYDGVKLGGLSSLAYDKRSAAYVSAVDNNGTDPARIWFFRNLTDPKVIRDPLVLKQPDGTPYTGLTSDNEGLAVLPNGDYLVSSETEPSIRIFGRDGVQLSSLPVPSRFQVAPAGEATSNATLEGLTISPSGKTIIAAMEGALSGDVSASGDATAHRFLVYTQDRRGTWQLSKQIEYKTETGQRVPEVAAYSDDAFLVEEASFSATTGNAVDIYAVTGLEKAKDVTGIANLSTAPAKDAVKKTLLADLVKGPTLGATALETQTNPLLDNFEGMAVTARGPFDTLGVSLISDDNFSATQRTRIVNLIVKAP
jgi:predicted extracellular nuclease